MSMFHIGQKVVCVSDFEQRPHPKVLAWPEKECVYTIRAIESRGVFCYLLLEEIINPPSMFAEGWGEPDFWVERFRPVRTTSIEIFQRMLAPQPLEQVS